MDLFEDLEKLCHSINADTESYIAKLNNIFHNEGKRMDEVGEKSHIVY